MLALRYHDADLPVAWARGAPSSGLMPRLGHGAVESAAPTFAVLAPVRCYWWPAVSRSCRAGSVTGRSMAA